MSTQTAAAQNKQTIVTNEHRNQLLEGLPISEHRLVLAGISTTVLVVVMGLQ